MHVNFRLVIGLVISLHRNIKGEVIIVIVVISEKLIWFVGVRDPVVASHMIIFSIWREY